MIKKSYKLKKRFYIILIIAFAALFGIIFKNNIKSGIIIIANAGKEKRVEIFDSESTKEKSYFVFTRDCGYAVYADKMIIKFYSGVKFNKEKNFEEMLKAENYREILNFYNLTVPEKIPVYYLAERVTDDFDSSAINVPVIELKKDKYMDSQVLSEIFIYRYYGIDYKEESGDNGISTEILNATEKERYNGESIRKLKKAGYSCIEANYGEALNNSIIINNKSTMDELKNFVLTVNEKYIKEGDEPPFTTDADIVFIAGSEKESNYVIDIYGKRRNEICRVLNALGYSKLNITTEERATEESYVRCSKKDYYTAYKIAKIAKIAKVVIEDIEENRIEIVTK